MKTDVVKPRDLFFNPTRLTVPLFQRPYVWSEDQQWRLLWEDIVRLIEVLEQHQSDATHFLGAIVIQQLPTLPGDLPAWNVIDGQQRLTTIQILLDALHGVLVQRDWIKLAGQVLPLVENPPDYVEEDSDRYKLWPTNRDRDSFTAVMSAASPVNYEQIPKSRLREAHKFFSDEISSWLGDDPTAAQRAKTLVAALTDRLEIASIRLDSNEDAQAIFETLNARGTPLSAADLIKNFVFQNLTGTPQMVEDAYHKYWSEFETPWWETLVTTGRITNSRASLFLWQWLTGYRVGTLDSEIARSLLIWLEEPEQNLISARDKDQVLEILESWFVRRALVKAASQGTNLTLIDLLQHLSRQTPSDIVKATSDYLAANHTNQGYWPGDGEVYAALETAPAYRKYVRARLRMVLEALEDNNRGYPDGKQLAMGPIVRGKGTIEHLMPQNWQKHWPARLTAEQEEKRDNSVQELGNLTLVTQKLNSTISNGSWKSKRKHFNAHDDVLITRDALNQTPDTWDESAIQKRTGRLIEQILRIWPAPPNHVGLIGSPSESVVADVDTADLVAAGWLAAGTKLVSKHKNTKYKDATASISQDGRVFIADTAYASPTGAARGLGAGSRNGWDFWAVAETGKTLAEVRAEYLASLGESDSVVADNQDESLVDDAAV